MSRGNRRRWSLRIARWHRWAGVFAALFTLVLAGTGLLLQHAPALGLDRITVGSAAVARWLDIRAPAVTAYRAGDQWLLAAGDGLWLDRRRIAETDGPLTGAVTTDFGFALTSGGDALLFDRHGRLIDRLRPGSGLPAAAMRIVRTGDGTVVIGGRGRAWRVDADWLSFERHDQPIAQWSTAAEAPAAMREHVRERELARSVTWERALLEVHSGRIGGTPGTFVMDTAAIALMVLAGTGLYLWWRRR